MNFLCGASALAFVSVVSVLYRKTNMTWTLSFFFFCLPSSFILVSPSIHPQLFLFLSTFHFIILCSSSYVNIMKKDSSRMWIILHHPLRVNITSSSLIRLIRSCFLLTLSVMHDTAASQCCLCGEVFPDDFLSLKGPKFRWALSIIHVLLPASLNMQH